MVLIEGECPSVCDWEDVNIVSFVAEDDEESNDGSGKNSPCCLFKLWLTCLRDSKSMGCFDDGATSPLGFLYSKNGRNKKIGEKIN